MSPASYLIIAIIIASISLAFMRKMVLTFVLLVANVAIFIVLMLTSHWGIVWTSPSMWELGFDPNSVVSGANLYTLVTSMFLHASIMHIAFNMVWLAVIGLMLEERVGKMPFGILYFATGIIGALVFAASYRFQPATVVGASGALYGIFGAYVRLYPTEKLRIYFIDLPVYVWLLVFLLIDFVLGIFQPFYTLLGPIAYTAHIGGLVGGLLLAPYIAGLKGDVTLRKRNYESLRPLATTLHLQEMLERLKKEEDPAFIKPWLEEFAKQTKCPKCGGALHNKFNGIACENSDFKVKF